MLVVYLSAIGENKPKGDKFVWIYENYRGHMMKAAYTVCRDKYISEDAVHETFMRVIKYMDRIDENDYDSNLGFLSIMTKISPEIFAGKTAVWKAGMLTIWVWLMWNAM